VLNFTQTACTYNKDAWFQSMAWDDRPRSTICKLGLVEVEESWGWSLFWESWKATEEESMEDLGFISAISEACQPKLPMLVMAEEEECEAPLSYLTFLAVSHQFPLAWNWSSAMVEEPHKCCWFSLHYISIYLWTRKFVLSDIWSASDSSTVLCFGVRVEKKWMENGSLLLSIYIIGSWREKVHKWMNEWEE